MDGNKNRIEKKMHCFYFIKPMPNMNANGLAAKLLALEAIEEVYVTEGDYGFLVKAKFKDKEPDGVSEYIKKNLNRRFNMALSYYNLKK
jgi:hypothetical protein